MQTTTSDVLAAADPCGWFSGCYGPTDESHFATMCEKAWRCAGVADGDPAVDGIVSFNIERAWKHGDDMCIRVKSNLGRGEKRRILVVTPQMCGHMCGHVTPSSACKLIVRSMGSLLSEIQVPLKRKQVNILKNHARRVRNRLLKLRIP